MDFKPITLEQKELFNSYLKGRRYETPVFTFTSLFIWKDWDPLGWDEVEGALCVKSGYHGWDAVLPPISGNDKNVLEATEALIDWYKQKNVPFLMAEACDLMVQFFERAWPGRFIAREYPEGANYVYLQEDLAQLPGKKYAKKRNHISQLERQYPQYKFLPLTADLVPNAIGELKSWSGEHDMNDPDLAAEQRGVRLALENFGKLDYTGACLVIGDRVEAFTLGEPLNSDTVIIHAEKANRDIPGAYAAINSFFARDYWQNYKYINRAEDMGMQGLRKAKMSWHPHHMEKKFHLRLK